MKRIKGTMTLCMDSPFMDVNLYSSDKLRKYRMIQLNMVILPYLVKTAVILATLIVGGVLLILRNKAASGSSSILAYAACLLMATFFYVLSQQSFIHNQIYLDILKALSYCIIFLERSNTLII